MTTKEIESRNGKAKALRVIVIGDEIFVESSEGKIAYKVSVKDGERSCTCGDLTSNIKRDPEFLCKHLLAVRGSNGSAVAGEILGAVKPRLNERFITSIREKDFVVYSGLLDLAHQKGLYSIQVEVEQFPTKENGSEAICKAVVESKSGAVFTEWGDASPKNTRHDIANHVLRMAATRAKARALRDFTNIGMTCLEELGEFDEVIPGDKTPPHPPKGNAKKNSSSKGNGDASNGKAQSQAAKPAESLPEKSRKDGGGNGSADAPLSNSAPPSAPDKKDGAAGEENLPKPSSAQMKAIENLARRRNITSEELEEMVQQQFGTTLENITTTEASSFIRTLQQSA